MAGQNANWNLFSPQYQNQFPTATRPQAPAAPAAPAQSPSWMQRAGTFANSPAGQAAIQGAGALFDAREQRNANQQLMERQDQQNQRTLETNAREGLMADDRARAAGVLDANPLGAMQSFAGKNAFLAAAPQMFAGMGSGLTPSDPAVAAMMPKGGMNFQLPPGFAEQMAKTYGQDATAHSIAQRQMDLTRLDPRMGNAGVLGSLGLGDTSGLDSQVHDFQHGEQAFQNDERKALLRAIDNDPTGAKSPEEEFNANFDAIKAAKARTGDWEKAYQQVTGKPWPKGQHITIDDSGGHTAKDASKWAKVGKVAAIAAPIAATVLTGGAASPWLAATVGGVAGAARSALNGGGLKGALMGGLTGAAMSGIPSGGGVPVGKLTALKSAVLSPKGVSSIASNLPGDVGRAAGMVNMFAPNRWSPGGR